MALTLFVYAFLSNVALALVPHEPVVVWYGPRLGIWLTAAVTTAGTLAASWTDHRVFAPVIQRALAREGWHTRLATRVTRAFRRAPFAIIALSGVTPLPFAPFKAAAFAARYPLNDYLAAVAAGRFPRYLLLAWLGAAFTIPTWALVAAFGVFLLPSLGSWLWQRVHAN
ncbi:MAG TPA: VTT domain-containing protein [Gemmatimonadales bacterium]|nr:VTT domain-containing protein [Gemmatimonadales bacterium]